MYIKTSACLQSHAFKFEKVGMYSWFDLSNFDSVRYLISYLFLWLKIEKCNWFKGQFGYMLKEYLRVSLLKVLDPMVKRYIETSACPQSHAFNLKRLESTHDSIYPILIQQSTWFLISFWQKIEKCNWFKGLFG